MDLGCPMTPDFSVLPPHIITHIIRYLDASDIKKVSTVCKSWYYASTDPQIEKTLICAPTEEKLSEICKSSRRYGVLRLQFYKFDKEESYYWEFFEQFCPFINELHIYRTSIKPHQFVKLIGLSTKLKKFILNEVVFTELPGPSDYDGAFVQNVSGVKQLTIKQLINITLIKDLLKYATNLDTFVFNNRFLRFDDQDETNPYQQFFTIFDNDNASSIQHLDLNLNCSGWVDDFIRSFVATKHFNLKWFKIVVPWIWQDEIYKSSLFDQFIAKLAGVVELIFVGELIEDQLSIMCRHLVNLKTLDCVPDKNQPISELGNLQKLENLYCRPSLNTKINEIDAFFKCKFPYLRKLRFDGFVTESNLVQLCENHPNLFELKLESMLTRNVEIIFKHLTQLRVLILRCGFQRLRQVPASNRYDVVNNPIDSEQKYEYDITRLEHLEEYYFQEYSIRARDLRQMKKLKRNNAPELVVGQNSWL